MLRSTSSAVKPNFRKNLWATHATDTPKSLASGRLPLQNFRAEFAVAHSGANLHFWPDYCDGADDFSALVHRDAVTATQRRVRPEHSQKSFCPLKTVSRVFD